MLIGMLNRDVLLAGQRHDAVIMAELFDTNAPTTALPGKTCRIVATHLTVHGLERLPAVASLQSRVLVDIVSRSDLVKPSLVFFDEKQRHERLRRVPLSGTHMHLELHHRRAGHVAW